MRFECNCPKGEQLATSFLAANAKKVIGVIIIEFSKPVFSTWVSMKEFGDGKKENSSLFSPTSEEMRFSFRYEWRPQITIGPAVPMTVTNRNRCHVAHDSYCRDLKISLVLITSNRWHSLGPLRAPYQRHTRSSTRKCGIPVFR